MAASAGTSHSAAIGKDGALFLWGIGTFAPPTRVAGLCAPVRQVAVGHRTFGYPVGGVTGIVTDAGDLFFCGCGLNGRLGLGDRINRMAPTLVARALFDGEAVLMVAFGLYHTAVLAEGGGVYSFGRGDRGQLGPGDEDQLAPRRVPAAGFHDEPDRDGGHGRGAHGDSDRGGARVYLGRWRGRSAGARR